MSWLEWSREVDALRLQLHQLAILPDSTIVHLGRNHRLIWSLALAAIDLGARFWPLNYRWTAREIERALTGLPSQPKLAIIEEPFFAPLEALLRERSITVLPRTFFNGPSRSEKNGSIPATGIPKSPGSLLISTGGTTGIPRVVSLSTENLHFNAENFQAMTGLDREDRVLVSAPNFHVAGFSTLTLAALKAGADLVIAEQFDAAALLCAIEERKITAAVMVPTMWKALLEAARGSNSLRSLRFGISGGAPMEPGLLERAEAHGFELRQGYGMTEAGPMIALMPPGAPWQSDPSLRTSSGITPPEVQVKIAGSQGRALPPGSAGEILLRGPHIIDRYFAGPEEANRAFQGGWLHTADRGYLDSQGHIHVLGRIDEMIQTGGELVAPAEVEAALSTLPALRDAAVFGLPDPHWGETVAALVVLEPSRKKTADKEEALLEALLPTLRILLAGYKLPRVLRIVEALPTTSAGKLNRSKLQRLWHTRSS